MGGSRGNRGSELPAHGTRGGLKSGEGGAGEGEAGRGEGAHGMRPYDMPREDGPAVETAPGWPLAAKSAYADSDAAMRSEPSGQGHQSVKRRGGRPNEGKASGGEALEELVRLVAAGAGYRGLAPELIVAVGARELAKRRNLKEAVKATRSKLHQVAGAYFPRQEYERWLGMLRAAAPGGTEALKAACREIMSAHASTRERLPVLDELYTRTLGDGGAIGSVLDVACGLNPLAIPWMPLAVGAEYHAYDVYPELAAFLDEALPLLGVRGAAHVADVTAAPPEERAEVALVCKALPCLEQLDKAAGSRLLDALNVGRLLVTYPVRSLGGRGKGMAATYDAQMRRLLEGRGWPVSRYDFVTELAYVVMKSAGTDGDTRLP